MGGLATKLAGNVLTEGSKRWIKGEAPSLNELVLTPKNMGDVADKQAIDQAIDQNRAGLESALEALGFFKNGTDVANKAAVVDIFTIAAEPLRSKEPYHFGKSDIAKRINDIGMSVSKDPDAWHTPPADVLFLHRKMAGLYLMAAKHNAVVDTRSIYQQIGAHPSLVL